MLHDPLLRVGHYLVPCFRGAFSRGIRYKRPTGSELKRNL